MKTTAAGLILISSLVSAQLAGAETPTAATPFEEPMVVYAEAGKQVPANVRIRTSDIHSWTSDDNHRLTVTTRRREQFLIEFERPCFNLKLGPGTNALVTDTSWLDRNGYVRLLNRDHLPFGSFNDFGRGNFRMTTNAYSAFCPIKDITALGKKPRTQKSAG